MITWNIEKLDLELKYTWKISRNATDRKTNLIITAGDGMFTGMGEAAPNIRYGESADESVSQFHRFVSRNDDPESLPELRTLIRELRLPKSLSFGIESAWFRY